MLEPWKQLIKPVSWNLSFSKSLVREQSPTMHLCSPCGERSWDRSEQCIVNTREHKSLGNIRNGGQNIAEINQIWPLCIFLQQTSDGTQMKNMFCFIFYWNSNNKGVMNVQKTQKMSRWSCQCGDGHGTTSSIIHADTARASQHSLIFLAWFIKGQCVISAGMGFEFLSVKACILCFWCMFDCITKFNWAVAAAVSICCCYTLKI